MQRYSTTGYLLNYIKEESKLKGYVIQIFNTLKEDIVVSTAVSVIVLVNISSSAIRADSKNRKLTKHCCKL
jgi:hypothetical protein